MGHHGTDFCTHVDACRVHRIYATAYRIGDSTTNIISPLMSYFAVVLAFVKQYDEDFGMGSLISTMLPYSITFLIGWTLLLVIWYLIPGLPIGPDVFIRLK